MLDSASLRLTLKSSLHNKSNVGLTTLFNGWGMVSNTHLHILEKSERQFCDLLIQLHVKA